MTTYGGTFDFSKANLEDLIPVHPAIEPIDAFVNTSQRQEAIEYPLAARLIAAAAEAKLIATATENPPGVKVEKSQGSTIKLGDWVQVTRKPRLASGVKRGEIFQVLRVNSHDGKLVIENPHENPKYILSARLGYLDLSEVCLVPRSNRLDTPTFIDVVKRNFPDRLQELLQNPPGVGVDRAQEAIEPMAETSSGVGVDRGQEAIETVYGRITGYLCRPKSSLEQAVKTSPGVEVDPVQKPFMETVEASPGVEVDRALSHKFLLCLKEGHNTLWYDGKNFVCEKWSAKTYCKRGVGSAKHQLRCHPEVKRLGNLQVVENSPADHKPIEVQATEPIEPAAKTSPGAQVDRVQHPIIEMVEIFPAASVEQAQEAIALAAKNLPGSCLKTLTAHQLLELFKFSAHIIEDFPGVKTEATVSQSAIAPAVKNPILTGITLSDRFLAR